jgi:hypothetical protein
VTRYLDLAEFFWLADQVTGLDTTTLVKASRVELADSALRSSWRPHRGHCEGTVELGGIEPPSA